MLKFTTSFVALALLQVTTAHAADATLTRVDHSTVTLQRSVTEPIDIWLSDDTMLDDSDTQVANASKAKAITVSMPADARRYLLLKGADGDVAVLAERVLPLEQASNFRDIGGYTTADGRTVGWGKAYRSGAMPLLTDSDYAYIETLGLGTVVDFRSLEEREVTPDLVDDKTGALFVSNDYSMKPLMTNFGKGDGENLYAGMEKMLQPQFRSMIKRLLADDGAVLYHCSAGQDRTGMATALIYDVLGVDRETILKDYHLSTELRRTQFEMSEEAIESHPDNFLVQFYRKYRASGKTGAEPLYTPSGQSHLAQFFTYLDSTYGGAEGYLKQGLGFTDADLARLRKIMLN